MENNARDAPEANVLQAVLFKAPVVPECRWISSPTAGHLFLGKVVLHRALRRTLWKPVDMYLA
eukprot:scaffold581097_cov45-Prasinocladus_malaysianus.AAC.2